jgi:hypothetical protein
MDRLSQYQLEDQEDDTVKVLHTLLQHLPEGGKENPQHTMNNSSITDDQLNKLATYAKPALRRSRLSGIRQISSRVLFCLIIVLSLQSLQEALVNQIEHLHRNHKLRSKPRLLKPRRDGAHQSLKLLGHLVHMIVVREAAFLWCKQVGWRQRSFNIRCTKRSHEVSVFRSESIELLAHRKGHVALDRKQLGVYGEATVPWVDPVCLGIGRIHGPFLQEFVRAKIAKSGVGLEFIGEREVLRKDFWTESWVTTDSSGVLVCYSLARIGIASVGVITLLVIISIEVHLDIGKRAVTTYSVSLGLIRSDK